MSFDVSRFEQAGIMAIASTAGIIVAGKCTAAAYRRSLKERLPEGGTSESIFPYLQVLMDTAAEYGLDCGIMGGPAKQALLDPQTTYSAQAREIRVSADPACQTRQKATLYRPSENTRRDADIFTTKVRGLPSTPQQHDELDSIEKLLEERVDDFAAERGFPKGPVVSLFGYETLKRSYHFTDYATNTAISYDGKNEIMSHSLGARAVFPVLPSWTLVVPQDGHEFRLPTSAPVRLLGRTLVRSLVARTRDVSDVYHAVKTITGKGLSDELLGDDWLRYTAFRTTLDQSFKLRRLPHVMNEQCLPSTIQFLLAHIVAPLAPRIEGSVISDMIRDDGSPIGKLAARIMGAHGSDTISESTGCQAAAA